MFETSIKMKTWLWVSCLLLLAHPACWAAPKADKTKDQKTVKKELLDTSKYITIDEIKPGMKAHCLTVFEGTKIEKFPLEVLSVMRNFQPGRDAILVQGTDDRFIHTGPVAGCSGTPVYIDGRLAGALAFGWTFSKDPLYGVTPIEEMLRVGQPSQEKQNLKRAIPEPGYAFYYSKPIDFDEV